MPSVLPYGCLLPHIHMVKIIVTARKSKLGMNAMHQSLRYGGKNHPANPMVQLDRVLSGVFHCLIIAIAFHFIPFSSFYEQIAQFVFLIVHQINEREGLWAFLGFIFDVWVFFELRKK